jgi:hypothetical protein
MESPMCKDEWEIVKQEPKFKKGDVVYNNNGYFLIINKVKYDDINGYIYSVNYNINTFPFDALEKDLVKVEL